MSPPEIYLLTNSVRWRLGAVTAVNMLSILSETSSSSSPYSVFFLSFFFFVAAIYIYYGKIRRLSHHILQENHKNISSETSVTRPSQLYVHIPTTRRCVYIYLIYLTYNVNIQYLYLTSEPFIQKLELAISKHILKQFLFYFFQRHTEAGVDTRGGGGLWRLKLLP